MNSTAAISLAAAPPQPGEWADVGVESRRRGWSARVWWLLWLMLLPPETQRTRPTRAGAVLMAVAMGIGMAAYNNANNVLFMALSLLLSCLVLSGVLSWVNFRGVRWRLSLPAHWRAGEPGAMRLELANGKKITPTYNLLFHARARRLGPGESLHLPDRLDAGGVLALDWHFQPTVRGLETVEVFAVESRFPFGFLRKMSGGSLRQEVWVWPARVPYEFQPPTSRQPRRAGDVQRRPGPRRGLAGPAPLPARRCPALGALEGERALARTRGAPDGRGAAGRLPLGARPDQGPVERPGAIRAPCAVLRPAWPRICSWPASCGP